MRTLHSLPREKSFLVGANWYFSSPSGATGTFSTINFGLDTFNVTTHYTIDIDGAITINDATISQEIVGTDVNVRA